MNANAKRSQNTWHFKIEIIEILTLHWKFAIFNLCFQSVVIAFDSNAIYWNWKHRKNVNNALFNYPEIVQSDQFPFTGGHSMIVTFPSSLFGSDWQNSPPNFGSGFEQFLNFRFCQISSFSWHSESSSIVHSVHCPSIGGHSIGIVLSLNSFVLGSALQSSPPNLGAGSLQVL